MREMTDRTNKLAQGVTELRTAVAEAGKKDRETLTQLAEQAHQKATKHADDLRKHVQVSWDNVRHTARTKIRNARADFKTARAQDRADMAEADADLAINIAQAAVQEAEYAVLDAALARADAKDAVAGV
jgi:dsDNA-specific endonuclease/ATPase MutS2